MYLQQRKYNLSNEEVIARFFTFITIMDDNKDFFINDLEEYYFRVRPKLSSKTVKLLLEVRKSF